MKKVFLFFVLSFSLYINSQDLLLHYKFDNNIDDSSTNGYNGNASGVTFVSDRNGSPNSAVSFDGINDFIDFPNLNELKPNLPVSFSFWIKYESNNVQDRVVFNTSFKEDINSGIYLTTQSSTGKLAVGYGDGSSSFTSANRRSYLSDNVIQPNAWHQIHIVILASNNMKVYLDCVELGGSYSGSGLGLNYSINPGSLGRHDQNNSAVASYYFKGVLDDFKYYEGEITPTTITTSFIDLPAEVCEDSNYSLPALSNNGISGTWLPEFDSSNQGTTVYSFIPNTGQCAGRFSHTIEVVNEITTSFTNLETTLCKGTIYNLPTISSNGITGSWLPVIDNTLIGTTNYTFTPDTGQCGTSSSHSIEITNQISTSFTSLVNSICLEDSYSLPTTSSNGISGNWLPLFDSSLLGTTDYIFTPDLGQCADNYTHSMEVTNKTATRFTSLENFICIGDSYNLPTKSSNGIIGSWSPVFDNTLIGKIDYTFTPDENSCGTIFNHTIEIEEKVTPVFLTLPKLIFINENFSLPNISDNGISGTWSPFFDSSIVAQTTYTFNPNNINCKNSFTHIITVSNQLVIPSFFTPNSDNTNDFWKIIGLESYLETKLFVYNRYGKLLSKPNITIGWDGKYNGKNMPSNDYWYHFFGVNINNEYVVRKGYFSLLRK